MRKKVFEEKIRKILEEKRLDAVLISKIVNVKYLTGFTGTSGFVVATGQKTIFITDPRYTEQARQECSGWEIVEIRNEPLSKWLKREISPKRLGVEEWLTLGALEKMKENLTETEFITLKDLVENLRAVKSEKEVEAIKKALRIAEEAFLETLSLVKPGVFERDIALELEYRMKKKGAEEVSFKIIVASGERSSLPHGVASTKRLKPGEIVLFDFGCVFDGYCSDITRVVKLGRLSPDEKRVWKAVISAMDEAISRIKPKEKAKQIHKAAEAVLEKEGLSRFFGHGLGHGVGLEIHEKPSLSALSEDMLEEGNVFTVEPGVYLPQRFGIRIEDIILLRNEKPVILTELSREVIEL